MDVDDRVFPRWRSVWRNVRCPSALRVEVGELRGQLADRDLRARLVERDLRGQLVEDYRATRQKMERKLGHLMRRTHGGRRARMRGQAKIDADFRLLAAAHNIARLAVLNIGFTTTGWAMATT